jgi:FkbM family methyltransferase
MVTIFNPHEALKYIKNYLPDNPIVVEAGAFNGSDTLKIAALWPQATIHAFEPVPEIFQRLEANTQHLAQVNRYQMALSDHDGTALFYVSEKPGKPGVASQAGSLHKPKERLQLSPILFPRTIEVTTISLNSWIDQYHITRIDLLWLDMQGHELAVLQAAREKLDHVRVIYTEVGFVQAYEGQQTCDQVCAWLEAHGFVLVGQDFKNQHDWFFGNLLFVNKRIL